METIAMSVDDLAGGIDAAAGAMAHCLLGDGKIMACGNGTDGALAQLFVGNLLSRYENERPALPALCLAAHTTSIAAIARNSGVNDIYARQLRALGNEGDLLLCLNSSRGGSSLVRAIQAAHERNVGVVLLSNSADDALGPLAAQGDIELRVEAAQTSRVVELHLMILHCFCHLIDNSLFGAYEQD